MYKHPDMIEGIMLTPLKIIPTDKGNVLHGVKRGDEGFSEFGESYFSLVHSSSIKGWKRHKKMTMNLMVPQGEIKFVIYDDREQSRTYDNFFEIILSRKNYQRLTIKPSLWFAFQGLGKKDNLLLNISNIIHDPSEVDSKPIDEINYEW